MSNKQTNFKKSNETQIGNFLVSKFGEDLKTIKVRSVAGNWAIQWRSDSEFYLLVEDMLKQEGYQYFINYITVCYLAGNGVKDNQFFNEFAESYTKMSERFNKQEKEISDEDDKRIIDEEREKYNESHNGDKI